MVKLKSGGDTALQGTVVTAPQVQAEGAVTLKIESLQDAAKYDSRSQSVGGSVTFGPAVGGSANYSGYKMTADYAAVGEQAGIRACDGGFQVNVAGATELIGGAITVRGQPDPRFADYLSHASRPRLLLILAPAQRRRWVCRVACFRPLGRGPRPSCVGSSWVPARCCWQAAG